MISSLSALLLLLLITTMVSADTHRIRTTATDSSSVSLIAQTPLTWETVEHDNLRYIRFTDSPVTDITGLPELPAITCLVAVPDSVTPSIEYAFGPELEQSVLPVYPVPTLYVDTTLCTRSIADSFYQDSTAYASTTFWPAERVRLIGETRICDQRLLMIQLYPAQYRAADSTLSTVTSFRISVSWDSTEAVWSSVGMGEMQRIADGSPILGYSPREITYAQVPEYLGVVDAYNGPPSPDDRMPDYLIICASGLFDYQFVEDAIENLAEHRVSQNGFDVATVLTDDIYRDFHDEGEEYLTPGMIRDFTEHMWENWPLASSKKPSFILLIGDHEDTSCASEAWFLPTFEYRAVVDGTPVQHIGNDEWYAYMNGDRQIFNDFPDIMVGRLSVRNGTTAQTDTLSAIIDNIIDLEDPITTPPVTDNRRRILRLAGTGQNDSSDTGIQYYRNWGPGREWTGEFCDWLDYDYYCHYCGDGRDFCYKDGSLLQSEEFRDECVDEFRTGAGVAFYTDHGELHMFSAGLEWSRPYFPYQTDWTKGAPDSTFNNIILENQLTTTYTSYSAPFVLMLCCLAGTFNHTQDQHETRSSHTYFCWWDSQGYDYDFGVDCLAEKMLKNTAVPTAGIFASSEISGTGSYGCYGEGILHGIYHQGFGRIGEAIAYSRLRYADYFLMGDGGCQVTLGQFNLLGDPALDISDNVRYPNKCDLVIHEEDISIGYPVTAAGGFDLPVQLTIHNNGHQNSGSFNTRIVFGDGYTTDTETISCSSINRQDSDVVDLIWNCTSGFTPPRTLTVSVELDYQSSCSDSWRPNNSAVTTVTINDSYPIDDDWPVETPGVVQTTPMLVNLDTDPELEIVVLAGTVLTAYDWDQSVNILWTLSNQGFRSMIQPIAASLDSDLYPEFLLYSTDGLVLVDNDGSSAGLLSGASNVFAAGDMDERSGLEICVSSTDAKTLKLYYWDSTNERFVQISSKGFSYGTDRIPLSMSVSSVSGGTYDDVCYYNGGSSGFPPQEEKSSIEIYNWSSTTHVHTETWNEYGRGSITLPSGELAGTGSVGIPRGTFDSGSTTDDPALIIEPDETIEEVSCSKTNVVSANNLRYGVFADWVAGSGTDTFVLSSERQLTAWDVDGDGFESFPVPEISGTTLGSYVSPTALGNLNGSGNAEALFATSINGYWHLLSYLSNRNILAGFPYILPENVTTKGGFAIGDIDRDGNVEIVFGTDDGFLHCWEFGTCTTGYLPWPQFQHDYGRSGALE